MTAQRFIESDLSFQFPAHLGVRKYDEQRFYRSMRGMGLKAVDFLVVDPTEGGHLYLIEVKNYRTRTRGEMVFEAPLKSHTTLADAITKKYKHTLKAIRAIHLFYQRRWWYRVTQWLWQKSLYWQYDVVFWTRAYQLVNAEKVHTVLLYLETEANTSQYRKDLMQEVSQRLPLAVNVMITDHTTSLPKGIQVTL